MADALRGTDLNQDRRFKDKEALAIKASTFPEHFDQKVDLRKVNIAVLRPWIAKRITEIMKFEDDVVIEYVYSMLEDKSKPVSDVSNMFVLPFLVVSRSARSHLIGSSRPSS